MIRRPPRSTLPDPRLPYTTLFRSGREQLEGLFHAFHDRLEADAGAPAEADARRGVGLGLDLDELVDRAGLLADVAGAFVHRSEEHTSELQSLMRISYAVFCLKKKKTY